MKITRETIDRIHEATDIVEVIGDFVSLKKKGHYYSACCPFHYEKTPSFTVTPSKGIYKCFGCGKAGDAIQFIIDIEGLSYIEAMKYLASKYGIEISEEAPSPHELQIQNERESLFIILNYAKNYFHKNLLEHEEGQSIGLSYFKERGFTENTIKKFELGYSLEEWEAFTQAALKDSYKLELLEKAGLVVKRENANDSKFFKVYDRFRGRVIFPIHNLTGKVIAFGARILKSDKSQPKYLNSPETEVYHKSKILYGIYQAKQAIRQEDACYLVEGYTDVISLHQGGVENVVASSGTSLTEDQIKLIGRYTQNITVLYDGDPAGIKASMRGIDMILEEGMNVSVVEFPNGEDPDSYIRKIGGAAFKEFIKSSAKDFITFKTELFLRDASNDPIKKAEVIKEIVLSIAKIPDNIKRAVFFRQCSNLLSIDEQTLISEYNKIQITNRQKQQKSNDPAPVISEPVEITPVEEAAEDRESRLMKANEREIIRLLINYASEPIAGNTSLAEYLLTEIEDIEFRTPVYKHILELLKIQLQSGNVISESYFINYDDKEVRKEAIDMLTSKYSLSESWEKHEIFVPKEKDILDSITLKSILRLKRAAIKVLIRENQQNMLKEVDPQEMENYLKIAIELQKLNKEINGMLGIVVG
ncbi:MAG TPA: DNA primase [Cytophagaceae bacterium]